MARTAANTSNEHKEPEDKAADNVISATDAPPVAEPVVSDLPPPGVIIIGGDTEVTEVFAAPARQDVVAAFTDEHVGKGGTYALDPVTGERKRVWERYDDNGTLKYRPVA